MKKSIAIAIFAIFLTFSAEAMISFHIVETGLPYESERSRHSIQWENTFLDVFFDAGYIVSNYPILRLESKPDESILEASGFDVFDAMESGIDYILIAQLDYETVGQAPKGTSIYIFSIARVEKIYEKHFSVNSYRSEREELEEIKKIIGDQVKFFNDLWSGAR
jgi:hypothetical protein